MSKMTGLAHMKNTYPRCCKTHAGEKIPLQEKQSQIIFSNPQKAKNRIFKIDGCVVADSVTRRCDYLLYDSNETEHFIELKGRDIKHAVSQLKTSVQKFGVEDRRKYCFIVSSRVPLAGTDIGNYKRAFKSEFKAVLQIKNDVITHSLPSPTQ